MRHSIGGLLLFLLATMMLFDCKPKQEAIQVKDMDSITLLVELSKNSSPDNLTMDLPGIQIKGKTSRTKNEWTCIYSAEIIDEQAILTTLNNFEYVEFAEIQKTYSKDNK